MNIYDKAHELAKAMRESSEFRALRESAAALETDADAKRMLDDFRQRQMDLQQRLMSGDTTLEGEMGKMQKLYEVVRLNPLVSKCLEAEQRVMIVMEDIQRIIADPLKDVLP